MPVQVSSTEIDHVKVLGYLKSLGFNVFLGTVHGPTNSEVYWERELGGDLKDFLNVAKSEGAHLIIANWTVLDEDDIEDRIMPPDVADISNEELRKEISARNRRLDALRPNIGKTGSIILSFLKDGTEFIYAQSTEWYNKFREIVEEIEGDDDDDADLDQKDFS